MTTETVMHLVECKYRTKYAGKTLADYKETTRFYGMSVMIVYINTYTIL